MFIFSQVPMCISSRNNTRKRKKNISINIFLDFGLFLVRFQSMPTECAANPLQRALADSIVLMQPLDEIRILLACGAKVFDRYG